jgi:TRAP-type C4-dicarboxylate transport system permease large subunit
VSEDGEQDAITYAVVAGTFAYRNSSLAKRREILDRAARTVAPIHLKVGLATDRSRDLADERLPSETNEFVERWRLEPQRSLPPLNLIFLLNGP